MNFPISTEVIAPLTAPMKNVKHPTPMLRAVRVDLSDSGRGGADIRSENIAYAPQGRAASRPSVARLDRVPGIGFSMQADEKFLDIFVETTLTNLISNRVN